MALSQSERLDFMNDFVLTLAMAVLRTFIHAQYLNESMAACAGAGAVLKACWVWESSLACTAGSAGIFVPRSSLTDQEVSEMHQYVDGHLHLDGPPASGSHNHRSSRRERFMAVHELTSAATAGVLSSAAGSTGPSAQLVENLIARAEQEHSWGLGRGQVGGSSTVCGCQRGPTQRSAIDGQRGIWVLKPAGASHGIGIRE